MTAARTATGPTIGSSPNRLLATIFGAVYLLLGIVGFFLSANHNSPINFLSLNVPDHFLHLASAIVLLAVGLGADRAVRGSRAATV